MPNYFIVCHIGDLNIANSDCCIGRGLASLSSKLNCNSFLFYLMQDVRNQFDIANDDGTVFGSITRDGLHEIKILKPKQDVVEKFEKLAIIIDEKINGQCQQIDCLINARNILLSSMTKVEIEAIAKN